MAVNNNNIESLSESVLLELVVCSCLLLLGALASVARILPEERHSSSAANTTKCLPLFCLLAIIMLLSFFHSNTTAVTTNRVEQAGLSGSWSMGDNDYPDSVMTNANTVSHRGEII